MFASPHRFTTMFIAILPFCQTLPVCVWRGQVLTFVCLFLNFGTSHYYAFHSADTVRFGAATCHHPTPVFIPPLLPISPYACPFGFLRVLGSACSFYGSPHHNPAVSFLYPSGKDISRPYDFAFCVYCLILFVAVPFSGLLTIFCPLLPGFQCASIRVNTLPDFVPPHLSHGRAWVGSFDVLFTFIRRLNPSCVPFPVWCWWCLWVLHFPFAVEVFLFPSPTHLAILRLHFFCAIFGDVGTFAGFVFFTFVTIHALYMPASIPHR